MNAFLAGVAQNVVADIVIIVFGGALAVLVALRSKLKLLLAVIRPMNSGVSNIYLQRSEYVSKRSRTVSDLIESAKRDFAYVGIYFSLATEQSRIGKSFTALLDQGCRVTIVLLDEGAPVDVVSYLEGHFGFARGTLAARAKHAKEYFLDMRATLSPAQSKLLDIRVHVLPLTASAFILDKDEPSRAMLLDQKWFAAGRDKSLGIEFTGKREDNSLQEAIYTSFATVIAASKSI